MSRVRTVVIGAVTGLALLFTIEACNDDEPTEAGPVNLSDPAVFEATMTQAFLPIVAGVADGLERLLVAIGGGTADGVVLTPVVNGVDATVSIDFNGDGSREGSISGSLFGDVTLGAQVVVTSIQTTEPSLSAGGSASVQQTQPGAVLLSDMGGSGSADPPGPDNDAEVSISDGAVTLDLVTGVATGFVDFTVSGDGSLLSVSAAFEPDNQGGFQVRFTGSGLDFTIP